MHPRRPGHVQHQDDQGRMDTDVDLSSGVRIRARKRAFETDSILRVDLKIISTQLEGDSRRPSE